MRAVTLLLFLVSLVGCRTSSRCTADGDVRSPDGCDTHRLAGFFQGCEAPCDGLARVEEVSPYHTPVVPEPVAPERVNPEPPAADPTPPKSVEPPTTTPPAEVPTADVIPARAPRTDLPIPRPIPVEASNSAATAPSRPQSDADARSARRQLELVGGRVVTNPQGRLVEVDLSNSKVTDDDLALLADESSLVELNLAGTSITNAGLRTLPTLPTLKILDLTATKITGGGLGELRRLTGLEFLLLSETKLDGKGLDTLGEMKSLRGLDLDGTDIDEQAVKRLHEALPDCRIYSGEPDAANDVRNVERLLSERMRDERFALQVAEMLERRGDRAGAFEVLVHAAEQPGASVDTRHRLAVALAERGDLVAARGLFEETVGPEGARFEIAFYEYRAAIRTARREMAETLHTSSDLPRARLWLNELSRLDRQGTVSPVAITERYHGESYEELPSVNLAVIEGTVQQHAAYAGPTIQPRSVHPPLQPVPAPTSVAVDEPARAFVSRAVSNRPAPRIPVPRRIEGSAPILVETSERTTLGAFEVARDPFREATSPDSASRPERADSGAVDRDPSRTVREPAVPLTNGGQRYRDPWRSVSSAE